jgi:excisionase family DNA binding protein
MVRHAGKTVQTQDNQANEKRERLLTREELAVALKVSLRTVDRMLADGEISPVKPHGRLVRFYLPDVMRQLVATALMRKRGRDAKLEAPISKSLTTDQHG